MTCTIQARKREIENRGIQRMHSQTALYRNLFRVRQSSIDTHAINIFYINMICMKFIKKWIFHEFRIQVT